MGNALLGLRRRRGRSIRVMRMDGHVFKIRAPATAGDVLTGHPGHVLLHSEALRQFGVRAAPLHASAELAPRVLYVLVQAELLPRALPRSVRMASDVSGSALSRLNALLLRRRWLSLSDVAASAVAVEEPLRLKLRLSKAELAALMASASATSNSDNDDVVSTSSSGSLPPPKTCLRTIPKSCRLPPSRGNRVRFKQQSGIEQES